MSSYTSTIYGLPQLNQLFVFAQQYWTEMQTNAFPNFLKFSECFSPAFQWKPSPLMRCLVFCAWAFVILCSCGNAEPALDIVTHGIGGDD